MLSQESLSSWGLVNLACSWFRGAKDNHVLMGRTKQTQIQFHQKIVHLVCFQEFSSEPRVPLMKLPSCSSCLGGGRKRGGGREREEGGGREEQEKRREND